MKILVITHLYPHTKKPHFGIFIKREVESMVNRFAQTVIVPHGWHPANGLKSLFSSNYEEVFPNKGVRVIYKSYFPLPGKLLQPLKGVWIFLSLLRTLYKLQKDFDFNIIHAHNVYPEGFCAVLLKKVFKRPVIISCRGKDLKELPDIHILKPFLSYTLKNADKIITVSKSLQRIAVSLKADPAKISVMPKGVDTHIFKPLNKAVSRKKLGLPMDKTIILSVGWIIPRKNPQSFIKILNNYTDQEKMDFLFVWIGEGKMKMGLESEILSNRLAPFIQMVGMKTHEEISLWINAADIFLLVSFSEGMPNVLYEAMACGVPVIVSNVDGASEIIEDMKTGVLVDPNDYNYMSKMILKLANNKFLNDKIGKKGLDYIMEKGLSWENNAEWLSQRYRNLVENR